MNLKKGKVLKIIENTKTKLKLITSEYNLKGCPDVINVEIITKADMLEASEITQAKLMVEKYTVERCI